MDMDVFGGPAIMKSSAPKRDMPSFVDQDRPAKVKEIWNALPKRMSEKRKAQIAHSTFNKMKSKNASVAEFLKRAKDLPRDVGAHPAKGPAQPTYSPEYASRILNNTLRAGMSPVVARTLREGFLQEGGPEKNLPPHPDFLSRKSVVPTRGGSLSSKQEVSATRAGLEALRTVPKKAPGAVPTHNKMKSKKGAAYIRAKLAEVLEGGMADGKSPQRYDERQLAMGIKVEMEHTNDRAKAKEIAMDHLEEDPDYYHDLLEMESEEKEEREEAEEHLKNASGKARVEALIKQLESKMIKLPTDRKSVQKAIDKAVGGKGPLSSDKEWAKETVEAAADKIKGASPLLASVLLPYIYGKEKTAALPRWALPAGLGALAGGAIGGLSGIRAGHDTARRMYAPPTETVLIQPKMFEGMSDEDMLRGLEAFAEGARQEHLMTGRPDFSGLQAEDMRRELAEAANIFGPTSFLLRHAPPSQLPKTAAPLNFDDIHSMVSKDRALKQAKHDAANGDHKTDNRADLYAEKTSSAELANVRASDIIGQDAEAMARKLHGDRWDKFSPRTKQNILAEMGTFGATGAPPPPPPPPPRATAAAAEHASHAAPAAAAKVESGAGRRALKYIGGALGLGGAGLAGSRIFSRPAPPPSVPQQLLAAIRRNPALAAGLGMGTLGLGYGLSKGASGDHFLVGKLAGSRDYASQQFVANIMNRLKANNPKSKEMLAAMVAAPGTALPLAAAAPASPALARSSRLYPDAAGKATHGISKAIADPLLSLKRKLKSMLGIRPEGWVS
jgi:hypothetical protein